MTVDREDLLTVLSGASRVGAPKCFPLLFEGPLEILTAELSMARTGPRVRVHARRMTAPNRDWPLTCHLEHVRAGHGNIPTLLRIRRPILCPKHHPVLTTLCRHLQDLVDIRPSVISAALHEWFWEESEKTAFGRVVDLDSDGTPRP
jgi:hypothetical protein